MKRHLRNESVSLFMTSPPFALRRTKEYGNKPADEYIDWFKAFAAVMWDKLKLDGSMVVDLGGSWNPGEPTRSLYQYELLIELCKHMPHGKNFHLAQEFFWFNPAKLPSPAQWVTIERVRVKDAVNVVWWLSKTPTPKASNKRVLTPYSEAMQKLLKRQSYNAGKRPGGQMVSREAWKKRHRGAIPPNTLDEEWDPLQEPENRIAISAALADAVEDDVNWLEYSGTDSMSPYQVVLRELEHNTPEEEREELRERIRAHPARFPVQMPTFFIKLCTNSKKDLVVDPFAGSNVTGEAAERAGRRWRAFELELAYLQGSVARFQGLEPGSVTWHGAEAPVLDLSTAGT